MEAPVVAGADDAADPAEVAAPPPPMAAEEEAAFPTHEELSQHVSEQLMVTV